MEILFKDTNQRALVSSVFIIDERLSSRVILETVIQSIAENIHVRSFDNANSALQLIEAEIPDLIIVDHNVADMSAIEFTQQLRALPNCNDMPIIITTNDDDKSIMYEALSAGATEFLTKPIDHYECKIRCKNLLTLRSQHVIIQHRAIFLEQQVDKATKLIQTREKETLHRLAKAGEYKDHKTGEHQLRIGSISGQIAKQLDMDEEFCDVIQYAAPMHDIGKIGIPDEILLKKDKLTQAEMLIMQSHCQIGYEILKDSPSPYLQMGAVVALNHHEKYDGTGYPNNIIGESIPLAARIVAVADVFDALLSKRTYKDAWQLNRILDEIIGQRGKHFDPACVDALMNCLDEIMATDYMVQTA